MALIGIITAFLLIPIHTISIPVSYIIHQAQQGAWLLFKCEQGPETFWTQGGIES